ncbi:flavodoxin family protein [Candidatus Parcubacteria bacterium]|jgi:flavodoxin|nr:MAG: flavodoxin family protein [Candidatus Parcubacteria bacterium]
MKTLVIYDSQFGNTEKIARAIGNAFGDQAKVTRPSEMQENELQNVELLIVGSPTQGGRATQAVQNFLSSLPTKTLKNTKVTAFDTRFAMPDQGFFVRFLMKTLHYAAEKIANALQAKGGILIAKPEGFFVNGKEGPLKDGELERAAAWAKQMNK